MKKMEAYRWLQEQGREVSFLANVILTQHSNPALKLKGLVKRIQQGHEFRIQNFDIDVLLMDGNKIKWSALEEWGKKNIRGGYFNQQRDQALDWDDPEDRRCIRCMDKRGNRRDCDMCADLADVPPGVGI